MISETHWTNPQYYMTLENPDDSNEEGSCVVIVALMQKYVLESASLTLAQRQTPGYQKPQYKYIGTHVYEVRIFTISQETFKADGPTSSTLVDGSSESYYLNCRSA